MAFYISDSPYPASGTGRSRPITTRWTPGLPYYSYGSSRVMARPSDGLEARAMSLNTYFQGQQYRNAGRVPAMDSFRQPGTPNPYGLNAVTMREQNQGVFKSEFEGREYIGGYPDDYASTARVSIPYGSDNLSLRYHHYQQRPPTKSVYGRPVYREGQQHTYPGAMRLSPSQIASWQAFFSINGFKTGPVGFWTEFEANAMRALMMMANGTPGGGMDVNVLRRQVEQEISSGGPNALQPGQLAGMLGIPATGQNELAPGGAGAGAAGDELAPYTETEVSREVTQYSTDQALMLLRGEFAREIGRRPTDKELANYVKGLNSALRADPTTITSVVRTDPGAGTIDRTVTRDESEVDPQGSAAEFAIEGVPQAEREGYQTQRYLEALMSELGM